LFFPTAHELISISPEATGIPKTWQSFAAKPRSSQDGAADAASASHSEFRLRSPRASFGFETSRKSTGKVTLKLPAELLSEIFLRCLPDEPEVPKAHSPPLLLGRICRYWRAVAFSTPALWAKIRIEFAGTISPSRSTFIVDWLKRSGDSPLTLELVLKSGLFHYETYNLLEIIMATSPRWQTVDFQMPISYAVTSFCDFRLPVPCLEALTLRIVHSGRYFLPSDTLEMFTDANKLRVVHIDCSYPSIPSLLVLPWPQLKSLRLSDIPSGEFIKIMNRCPNLTHCEIFRPKYFPETGWTVTLPHLHSLTIDFQQSVTPLNNLIVPSLRKLTIDGWWHEWYDWQQHILPFLAQPRVTYLQKLHIKYVVVSPAGLVQCLELTPYLVELDFREQYHRGQSQNAIDGGVLKKLTYRPFENAFRPTLVPCLERLTLHGTGPFGKGLSCLEMIQSRWALGGAPKPIAKLRYVQLLYRSIPPGPETVDGFMKLKREGLHIEVLGNVCIFCVCLSWSLDLDRLALFRTTDLIPPPGTAPGNDGIV
jgi:hypothetical protein